MSDEITRPTQPESNESVHGKQPGTLKALAESREKRKRVGK